MGSFELQMIGVNTAKALMKRPLQGTLKVMGRGAPRRSQRAWERDARLLDLRPSVKGYEPPPENVALRLLTAQSYLRLTGYDLSFLEPLVRLIEERLLMPDGSSLRMDDPLFEKYVLPTMDVLEKFGYRGYAELLGLRGDEGG